MDLLSSVGLFWRDYGTW